MEVGFGGDSGGIEIKSGRGFSIFGFEGRGIVGWIGVIGVDCVGFRNLGRSK